MKYKLPKGFNTYSEYLQSDHWKSFRKEVWIKTKGECEACGVCNDKTNVHHLHYRTLGEEDFCDVMILCRICHEKFHNLRKINVENKCYLCKKDIDQDWKSCFSEIENEKFKRVCPRCYHDYYYCNKIPWWFDEEDKKSIHYDLIDN